MEHSRYFFFLANGAGAMNRYYRELLSPQTGIAALTLTVMKGFEAKKVVYHIFFPYPYTPRYLPFDAFAPPTGVEPGFIGLQLRALTTTLRSLHRFCDKMSYLN